MKNEEEVKDKPLTASKDLNNNDIKNIDNKEDIGVDSKKEEELQKDLTEFSKELFKDLNIDPDDIKKFLPKDLTGISAKFSEANKYLANILNTLSDKIEENPLIKNEKEDSTKDQTDTLDVKDEDSKGNEGSEKVEFNQDFKDLMNYNFQEEFSSFLKEKYGDSIRIKSASSESTEEFPDIKGYKVELEMKSKNEDGTDFVPPKDLNEEFEKYLKEKFNGRINVVSIPLSEDKVENIKESIESLKRNVLKPRLIRKKEKTDSSTQERSNEAEIKTLDYKNFNYKPKDIKEYLDRFVINQDEAKKALAIAVCDHYNHVRECQEDPSLQEKDYAKQNILILGPTGVGKTYLVRQIAKLIGVPFVKADATRFSETGYVGANVDDLISDLVQQAGGDVDVAKYGIVYLDEADKLAARTNLGGKDISGRGVQFGLLKLMEDTDVDLSSSHDMRSQLQSFMEFQKTGKIGKKLINTRHILFIISGSFNYLADIIKNRLNQNSIGFANEVFSFKDKDQYFEYATTADFIEFGFEPEFIGRLPVRVSCRNLSINDLYSILKNSEGSIIRQYVRAFKNYGIDLSFKDEALKLIAEQAFEEKTGARALMTICEKIFRDFKYELPSTSVKELKVDKNLVQDPKGYLERLLSKCRRKRSRSNSKES